MNVFELRGNHHYIDDRIKISFSEGDISKQLSVYLFDDKGSQHHVYWKISDSSHQNFSKINDKIKDFVMKKVSEWIELQRNTDNNRRLKEEQVLQRKNSEIRNLVNNF